MIDFDAPAHDSCHHQDTTYGDTFGGLGTSREVREEELLDSVLVAEPQEVKP